MKKFFKRSPFIYDAFKKIYYVFMALYGLTEWFSFKRAFRYISKKSIPRFITLWEDVLPCLQDRSESSSFDKHYVYHTAWAARILADRRPKTHIDISSCLRFVTLVSAFIPVKFYDFRPAEIELDNLESCRADILALPFEDASVDSLSCMHVVEHIGLGRYGDPLDADGDIKAINELCRVLGLGGELLFVVPIGGTAKIMFNAHRIYTYDLILEYFSGFDLLEFALIPDDKHPEGLIRHAPPSLADEQIYGCGCFRFKKPQIMQIP
jgi:SAM-dependent methyltransferase